MVNGDRSGMSFSTLPAVAGYPHISVPAGLINELPVALSLVSAAWSDAKLLQLAYAYEQASLQRRAPRFLPTLKLK